MPDQWPEQDRPPRRLWRRVRWWLRTIGCECHWHEPYGEVVMAGCRRHD